MTEHFFSYKNLSVYYKKYNGQLPVILMLHGFAEDNDVWKKQVDYLKNHFTLIVPDIPGSGKSSAIKKEIEMENLADIFFELLQSENINECILLGHSMGGYITLTFAKKYPQMLKGFGLIHSTAFADSDEKKENRKKGIEMMKQYGGYSFIKNTTPNLFSSSFKKESSDEVEALVEKGKTFDTQSLQYYYYAMMNRSNAENILKNFNKPVLFIAGKNDVAVSLNDSLKQMYLPAVSYITILQNAGHMGIWEESENVGRAILNFANDITT